MAIRHGQGRRRLAALAVAVLGLLGSGCVAPSTPCSAPPTDTANHASPRASTDCDSSRTNDDGDGAHNQHAAGHPAPRSSTGPRTASPAPTERGTCFAGGGGPPASPGRWSSSTLPPLERRTSPAPRRSAGSSSSTDLLPVCNRRRRGWAEGCDGLHNEVDRPPTKGTPTMRARTVFRALATYSPTGPIRTRSGS
jgi:hypothetical protein